MSFNKFPKNNVYVKIKTHERVRYGIKVGSSN